MKTIRGTAKMCCLASDAFRDDVISLARSQHQRLQDFLLTALRDKVYAERKARRTLEGRRRIALENLFLSRKAPDIAKRIVDAILAEYMPEP